jgi:DNA-binding response OmpR family regulator
MEENKLHPPAGGKQKILIIEDEETLQKALQEILLQENYEVVSALDGELGFKMASSEMPDIILLDLILPKMDGFEVLEALKKDEKTKKIPIIILTNLGGTEDVQKALVFKEVIGQEKNLD